MNQAAVDYLETVAFPLGSYSPREHVSESYPEATVQTCGGVIARRPMFELIEDHETDNSGKCWLCRNG